MSIYHDFLYLSSVKHKVSWCFRVVRISIRTFHVHTFVVDMKFSVLQKQWIRTQYADSKTSFSPCESSISSQNLENDSEGAAWLLLLYTAIVFAPLHDSHSWNREHSSLQQPPSKNISESMSLRVIPDDGAGSAHGWVCPRWDHQDHVTQTRRSSQSQSLIYDD